MKRKDVLQDTQKHRFEIEQLRKAAGVKVCPRCRGNGWLMGRPHTKTCPDCRGTGKAK